MKWSKFSEEQIAHALRRHEAGAPVEETACGLGVGQSSFYA